MRLCEECRNYSKLSDRVGECRLYPPSQLFNEFANTPARSECYYFGWPRVMTTDWCGQYSCKRSSDD